MSENWRSEWSRHYDQIQWIATTVFTTGIAALLSYSYSQPIVDLWIISIGIWLTIVTIYYALSFRELRHQLHLDLSDDSKERDFLLNKERKKRLRQWPIFFVTFLVLTAAWVRQFFKYDYRLGFLVGLVSLVILVWIWQRGKRTKRVPSQTSN